MADNKKPKRPPNKEGEVQDEKFTWHEGDIEWLTPPTEEPKKKGKKGDDGSK